MILGFWTLSVILGDGAWGSTSLPWESCLIWWSWASSCNWCPCLLGTVAGVGHRVGNIFLGQLPKKRVSKEKLGLYRGSNWQSGYEGLNHSNPKQQYNWYNYPKRYHDTKQTIHQETYKFTSLVTQFYTLSIYSLIQQEIIDVTNNHLEELRRLAGREVTKSLGDGNCTHRSGHIGDGLWLRLPH